MAHLMPKAMAREYQRKLEELFRAADTDGDDSLSAEEFTRAMSLPSVQRYMQVLEVSLSRQKGLAPRARPLKVP